MTRLPGLMVPILQRAIRFAVLCAFIGASLMSPWALVKGAFAEGASAEAASAEAVASPAADDASDAATRRLIRAAERGRVQSVLSALEEGARIDEQREAFVGAGLQTPLVSAALRGYDRVVRVLLEKGADPTLAEKDGFTVWHAAAFQGRTDVLVVLDELDVPGCGISPADGFTPLHRAAWGQTLRHVAAVRFLIARSGLACDVAARDGQTPLDVAKHEEIKKILAACQP